MHGALISLIDFQRALLKFGCVLSDKQKLDISSAMVDEKVDITPLLISGEPLNFQNL